MRTIAVRFSVAIALLMFIGGAASAQTMYLTDQFVNTLTRYTVTGADLNFISLVGTGHTAPSGMAVDSFGNVYVGEFADVPTGQVRKYAATAGPADGPLATSSTPIAYPEGMTVDGTGTYLYVAQLYAGCIQKLRTSDLVSVASFCGRGLSGLPRGIVLNPTGTLLYVVTSVPDQLFTVNADFSGTATKVGDLPASEGRYLLFDSVGNLFVSFDGISDDSHANGSVYQYSGGTWTQLLSGLRGANGLAFDSSQNLFIADYYMGGIERSPRNSTALLYTVHDFITNVATGFPLSRDGPHGLGMYRQLGGCPVTNLLVNWLDPIDHWAPPPNIFDGLQIGSTLPIKFWLQNGTAPGNFLVPNLHMAIIDSVSGVELTGAEWSIGKGNGNLKYDPHQYLVNFQSKDFSNQLVDGHIYEVVIYTDNIKCPLGDRLFYARNHADRSKNH